MRRVLPPVIALLLGVGAAVLVACGSGGTKGGIPAASAGELKDQLDAVRRAVADKRCDDVDGELSQVEEDIGSLPGTVDKRLRKSLGDAADLLRQTSKDECKTETTQTQTQKQPVETETQTQPPETQTQTLPPQTQTTPPATTTTPATTQPPATTTTPPVTPPPPPAEPPAPVPAPPPGPGGSGGGATPEIP